MTIATPLPADPPHVATETEMLAAFLDSYRGVMARKVEGLEPSVLRWSPVASGTCLGGLIKHLAYVERKWFQAVWAGRKVDFPWTEDDPDADFALDEADTADTLVELYRQECEESRRVMAERPDLDATVTSRERSISGRWIMIHMVEETARHVGHADLIREQVDGSTGD